MSVEPILWVLAQPLKDKRVVITRAAHQAQELATWLEAFSAKPLFYPAIEIMPPENTVPLDAALMNADSYDWLLLTSANTVVALKKRLTALHRTPESFCTKIGAIGAVTAQAAQNTGFRVDFVSNEANDAALGRDLPLENGMRVLLPQSGIASSNLANVLRSRGAEVHTVIAYRTVRGHGGDLIPSLLARGEVDAIVFSSSSTVHYFLERLDDEGGHRADLRGVVIACFGRSAANAARDAGLHVDVVPSEASLDQLVFSLGEYFDAQ